MVPPQILDMPKPKVHVYKGLPASGKSTQAKKLARIGKALRVNKDDLRAMLTCGAQFSPELEKLVLKIRDLVVTEGISLGKNVIVDDTNLHPKHETRIRQLVRNNAEVAVTFFDIPLDECIRRNAKRPEDEQVPEEVIRNMYDRFLKYSPGKHPSPGEYFKGVSDVPVILDQDESLPPAIIVDVDGTLAWLLDRNPYDASNCASDLLNHSVANLVKLEHANGTTIVVITGREEKDRTATEDWLQMHEVPYKHVYMRVTGDKRKDTVAKKEIFETHVFPNYFTKYVLEDRRRVVDMWRALGLQCFQVAPGEF